MLAIKHIALKGVLLIGVTIVLNYIYQFTFFQEDLKEYSGIYGPIQESTSSDILYLGDCSDSYFGVNKTSEKGISQILDSLMTNKSVATISETGFNSEIYAAILNNLPQTSKLNTIVVTMNLRSFSSYTYYSSTYNSINQRLTLLNTSTPPLYNRFLLSFKKSQIYSGPELQENKKNDYKNQIITDAPYSSHDNWTRAFDQQKIKEFDYSLPNHIKEKAKGYITNYAFQIDEKTSTILNGFDQIVAIAKEKNLQLIFHFLPENTKECKELIGNDLSDLISNNHDFLVKRYRKNEVIIIDNFDLLEGNGFIENIPNSHYDYNARKLMAIAIQNQLIKGKN